VNRRALAVALFLPALVWSQDPSPSGGKLQQPPPQDSQRQQARADSTQPPVTPPVGNAVSQAPNTGQGQPQNQGNPTPEGRPEWAMVWISLGVLLATFGQLAFVWRQMGELKQHGTVLEGQLHALRMQAEQTGASALALDKQAAILEEQRTVMASNLTAARQLVHAMGSLNGILGGIRVRLANLESAVNRAGDKGKR
jgi:hypothetical protein